MASKLVAGRLKDLELVGAVLKLRLGKAPLLRRRIAKFPLDLDKQKAHGRLNVVLEDLGASFNP